MAIASEKCVEREMNRHQRAMVDGCFEEGHYEQGISTLNQLRSANVRPTASHIRQLIFIALYPPSGKEAPGVKAEKGKRRELPVSFGSPAKNARRGQRSAPLPTTEDAIAARKLLIAFALTNAPESLLRAIPCHQLTDSERAENSRRKLNPGVEPIEDLDSYLARESVIIKSLKDCWDLLKSDVVKRKDAVTSSKTSFSGNRSFDSEDDEDEEEPSTGIIGEHSWPLLEWLVILFEKDQKFMDGDEDRYSLLLLSQLKPPADGQGPRSGCESVMNIIFMCYHEESAWRRDLGRRLMSLLINLTATSSFSTTHFLDMLCLKLRVLAPELLSSFLSELPIHTRGRAFLMAVCDRYLTQGFRLSAATRKSRISARRSVGQLTQTQSQQSNSEPSSRSNGEVQARTQALTLPTTSKILNFLSQNCDQIRGSPDKCIILFYLLSTFGQLKQQEGMASIQTADYDTWNKSLINDDLIDKIEYIFSDDAFRGGILKKIQQIRELLCLFVRSWSIKT